MDRILGAAGLAPIDRTVPTRLAYAAGCLLEMIYGAPQASTGTAHDAFSGQAAFNGPLV